MKIISVVCIIIAGIIAIACANLGKNTQMVADVTPQSTAKWKAKAPDVFNNMGYSKLVNSVATKTNKKTESQRELVGVITNPFGIRDDVLDYILTKIPESNTRARIAAIKMAYYDQQMIGVTDDKQLNLLANKAAAGSYCFNANRTMSLIDSNVFVHGYDKLLRNTPQRLKEQNRIEHLLNGHVITDDFGINTYDFKKQCDYFLESSK